MLVLSFIEPEKLVELRCTMNNPGSVFFYNAKMGIQLLESAR